MTRRRIGAPRPLRLVPVGTGRTAPRAPRTGVELHALVVHTVEAARIKVGDGATTPATSLREVTWTV